MTDDLFTKITQSILTSADRKLTMADLMLEMASHLNPNDPERIFTEWLVNNRGRHREACRELGVEYPPEGDDLLRRLKAVVMPVLVQSARADKE